MRLAAVVAVCVVAVFARTAAATPARGCAWGAVQAGRSCLVDGHACSGRHLALYRRHGFACRNRLLVFDWRVLRRRPLPVQAAPGTDCPVSAQTGTLARFGLGSVPAWGAGPAWPVFGGVFTTDIPFEFASAGPEYAEWGERKAMWAIDPRYVGPTLVRGRQLDGPNELRFENGSPGFTEEGRLHPATELRFVGGYVRPAVTRARALGCYAFQIDGLGFSRRIVFRAVAK